MINITIFFLLAFLAWALTMTIFYFTRKCKQQDVDGFRIEQLHRNEDYNHPIHCLTADEREKCMNNYNAEGCVPIFPGTKGNNEQLGCWIDKDPCYYGKMGAGGDDSASVNCTGCCPGGYNFPGGRSGGGGIGGGSGSGGKPKYRGYKNYETADKCTGLGQCPQPNCHKGDNNSECLCIYKWKDDPGQSPFYWHCNQSENPPPSPPGEDGRPLYSNIPFTDWGSGTACTSAPCDGGGGSGGGSGGTPGWGGCVL